MRELSHLRATFGHDDRAINKHAVRVYEHAGRRFTLDRTLDGVPPFFTLFEHPASGEGLSQTIHVAGEATWGSGYGWERAEAAARRTIEARYGVEDARAALMSPERAVELLGYAAAHYGNLPFAFRCPYPHVADGVLVDWGMSPEEASGIERVREAMYPTARFRDAVWHVALAPLYEEAFTLSRRAGSAFIHLDEATGVCSVTEGEGPDERGDSFAHFRNGLIEIEGGLIRWGEIFFAEQEAIRR